MLQGSVEDGIAGGVDEVGEDYGVFFGEGVGVAGAEEQPPAIRTAISAAAAMAGIFQDFFAAAGDGASPVSTAGTLRLTKRRLGRDWLRRLVRDRLRRC